MEVHMLSVAIEGPCCAGKTTLGKGLMQEMNHLSRIFVTDYSDYVGGGRFLPPPVPKSWAEEERSLETFLSIEANRTLVMRSKAEELQLVLIDRSIYTLLAHCSALEHVTGLDLFRPAEEAIKQSSIPVWPNVVLYLDASLALITGRNKGKFEEESIYMNPEFNEGIRIYFSALTNLQNPPVCWLDASSGRRTLLLSAKTWITKWLSRQDDKVN